MSEEKHENETVQRLSEAWRQLDKTDRLTFGGNDCKSDLLDIIPSGWTFQQLEKPSVSKIPPKPPKPTSPSPSGFTKY